MSDLKGKKILFVAPRYFGYEIEIKKKLEEAGAYVKYFDERPSNTSFVKASIRINRKIIARQIYNYYKEIIETNRIEKFDYVFFIQVETPFGDILTKLRESNPDATYILYMWDSMFHNYNTSLSVKYFDKVFSYDRIDAIRYKLKFRPLFYLDEYSYDHGVKTEFDILFIGTIHSDRYKIIREIKKQSQDMNLKTYWFLYLHNKLLFYKMKFSDFSNLAADISEFSFTSLNKSDIIDLIKRSKAVVDMQHPDNNGLTMRAFEILAMRRKLITTNCDIVNYDFYNPENILLINRKQPVIDKSFFSSGYIPVKDEIYRRYSLDCWISDIFIN